MRFIWSVYNKYVCSVDTVPEAPKKKKNTRSETPPARKIGVVAITDKIISLAKQEEELRAEREHVTDRYA